MEDNTTLNVGGNLVHLSHPGVMAIVNVTPDSFFSGSRNRSEEEVCRRVVQAAEEGASMLDVGGYSSRPGAEEVTPKEEYERVALAMRIIRERYPQMVVSVDTFRASVAERVVENFGAVIINDISAGEMDEAMIPTVARLRVPYIAMHMRGTPKTMQQMTGYADVTAEIVRYFSDKMDRLIQAGVYDIILDPGFGFAKTVEENYELLRRMSNLLILGRPVLAGISRKAMIWKALESTPEEALTGTTALHWECLRQGASILRVHDVKEAVEVVKLYEVYQKSQKKF